MRALDGLLLLQQGLVALLRLLGVLCLKIGVLGQVEQFLFLSFAELGRLAVSVRIGLLRGLAGLAEQRDLFLHLRLHALEGLLQLLGFALGVGLAAAATAA